MVALQAQYLRVRMQLNARIGVDAVNQVLRHGGRQALPGGVTPANQSHVAALDEPAFDRRSPIRDAATLEARQFCDIGAAVRGAAGNDDGTRFDSAAVGQGQCVFVLPGAIAATEAFDPRRNHDLGTELLCLQE